MYTLLFLSSTTHCGWEEIGVHVAPPGNLLEVANDLTEQGVVRPYGLLEQRVSNQKHARHRGKRS
jgi:hypothetical protein